MAFGFFGVFGFRETPSVFGAFCLKHATVLQRWLGLGRGFLGFRVRVRVSLIDQTHQKHQKHWRFSL
jgi:hypothetical protein